MIGLRELRPRAAGVTALLVVLAALWLPFAPAASAHDELVSSSPGSGDTVAAPRTLTLTYSERLIQTGYRVVVRGPEGPVDGDVQVSGETVVERFGEPLAAGPYTVAWRVVSADGHPVSGRLAFTVRGAAASSSGASSSSASSSASSSTSPAASSSPTPSNTGSASDGGGQGRTGLALAGLAAVVVAAAAALGLARRSRNTPGQ